MDKLQPIHCLVFLTSPVAIYVGLRAKPSRYDTGSPSYYLAKYGRGALLISGWGGVIVFLRILLFGL